MELNQVQKNYIIKSLEKSQNSNFTNRHSSIMKFVNSIGISEEELKKFMSHFGSTVGHMKKFLLTNSNISQEEIKKLYYNKKNTDRLSGINQFNIFYALILFVNKKLGMYFMYEDIGPKKCSLKGKKKNGINRKKLIEIIRINNLEDELCNTFAEFIEVPIYEIEKQYGLKEKFTDKKIAEMLEELEELGRMRSLKYSTFNQKMYSIESLGYKAGELEEILENDYISNSYHIKIEMKNSNQANQIISQVSNIFDINDIVKRQSKKKNNYSISFTIKPYKYWVETSEISSEFIDKKTAMIMIENAELRNRLNRIEANVRETNEYQTIQNKLISLLEIKRAHKNDEKKIKELEDKVKELEGKFNQKHAGGRPEKITEQQKREIKKSRDKGYSIRRIADEHGLSSGTVHKIVNEHKSKKNG